MTLWFIVGLAIGWFIGWATERRRKQKIKGKWQ